jgi:hypothetical protein
VPFRERSLLRAISRRVDLPRTEIMNRLSEINSISAANSGGVVSKECWVTAQTADGEDRLSAALNIGQQPGSISQLLGGMDLADWIHKNFRAAPGREIGLVQSAGVIKGPGAKVPIPSPEGKPRDFIISGSSIKGLLKSPSGRDCVSIEIVPLSTTITAKRNESITIPFAEIRLTAIQPVREKFAKPMPPWPTLASSFSIDGAAVLRGWEYTVCYWIEHGAHHVEIPQSSSSIRKIAFLNNDDELVIVAPTQARLFNWRPIEVGPTGIVDATVCWRVRSDGTRG